MKECSWVPAKKRTQKFSLYCTGVSFNTPRQHKQTCLISACSSPKTIVPMPLCHFNQNYPYLKFISTNTNPLHLYFFVNRQFHLFWITQNCDIRDEFNKSPNQVTQGYEKGKSSNQQVNQKREEKLTN